MGSGASAGADLRPCGSGDRAGEDSGVWTWPLNCWLDWKESEASGDVRYGENPAPGLWENLASGESVAAA